MKEIGNIFLAWRAGKGKKRHIVGVIKRNVSQGVRFMYLEDNLKDARQDGFTFYTDFPNVEKIYTDNILEKFGQRLTKSDRADIQDYYDFWDVKNEYKDDKYYLLAHTQGLLATDNYEFLAEYRPIKGLSFVSEICGLSHNKVGKQDVQAGVSLSWEKDTNNEYDKFAVKVYNGNVFIGYIKKIHNRIFYSRQARHINIVVKSIVSGEDRVEKIFITINIV